MTWANLAFPQFRKIIVDYFVKLAGIGADGVHVDEMYPTALDYNPDSPMSPDTATWEGAILLSQEIMRECRKANPSWCMSFECNWDRVLQFGDATWWVGNQLITRKVFPEHVETLGICQAYDYLGVNNAVRDGHAVMVAPLSFSRGLDWPPVHGLANYIKEVKRIRDTLQDTVFFGESLGQSQVQLKGGPPDGVAYNVFRNRATGRRVCILTNSRLAERRLSFPAFDGRPGRPGPHSHAQPQGPGRNAPRRVNDTCRAPRICRRIGRRTMRTPKLAFRMVGFPLRRGVMRGTRSSVCRPGRQRRFRERRLRKLDGRSELGRREQLVRLLLRLDG